MITLYALAAAFGIGVLWLGTTIKVVKQFERGVVFRFGRVQSGLRGPGLTMLIPIADRLDKVNMQIITMAVPSQDGITRDNVTVRVAWRRTVVGQAGVAHVGDVFVGQLAAKLGAPFSKDCHSHRDSRGFRAVSRRSATRSAEPVKTTLT